MTGVTGNQDPRVALRVAVYDGDGAALVAALADPSWTDTLQIAGQGLLVALAQRSPGAVALARRCIAALGERDWTGDRVLAGQLAQAIGEGSVPPSRPLPADLEDLAMILEQGPAQDGGWIDLRTGEVWSQAAIDYAVEAGEADPEDVEDTEHWLAVRGEGSRDGYRDMQAFIDTVDDADRAEKLTISITGRGAFRRFKDTLAHWPGELERWHTFAGERQRGRARAWLADAGYAAVPRSRPPR